MREFGVPVEVAKQIVRIAGKCALCVIPFMPWRQIVTGIDRKHEEKARRKRVKNYDKEYENLCKEADFYRSL